MWRMDLLRQWLPKRGMNGILQVYGVRARRRRKVGERWPSWEADSTPKLHTIERDGEIKIK